MPDTLPWPFLLILQSFSLTDPRQQVSDEHVYHAGAAELGVHEDHTRQLLAHLPDGGHFFAYPLLPRTVLSWLTRPR